MCLRGLLLLLLNEQVAQKPGQDVGTKIIATINQILDLNASGKNRTVTELGQHAPVVQFMGVMPYKMLHELVMQLQNVLTHVIIAGGDIDYQLFKETVNLLDSLHWLNFTFKDSADQI
jgi:hypothetical protein